MADVQILRAQTGIKDFEQIGWQTVAEIPASSFTAGDKYLILAPALASYTGTADELRLRLVKGDGSYRSTVSGDSPLHYYYMDESSGNLTDNGSAAQTLTKVGTTQVYSQPTLVPSLPSATSISFNYTASTYYQNTSATLPNTGNGSWTVDFWAKVPADNNSTCEFTGWGTNTGNNNAVIRLIGGRLAFTNPTQGDLYLSPTGTDYSDGSAHHYVVTYNGTTLTGYIDGVATGTTANPTGGLDITTTSPTLRIGGGYTTWFNGSIDEVSYYSSALSGSTALAHYNAGVGAQFTDQYESDEVLGNKVVGVGFMAVYTQPSPAVPVFLQASTSTYAQETRVKKVDLIAINLDDIGTQNTDYWYSEDTTDHSLSTTPVDGASVTFTPNGTDKYLYIAQATWTPNDNSIEQTYIDLLYDGTGMRRVSEEGEDASSNEQRNRLLMWANTPTNASHTVKVQGSMEAGTTSTLVSSRVIAINLAKFAESHVAVGSDYRLAAFDTWESALSTSFTPSATRDYVVIAHGAGDFGSNQNPDTSWRLMGNPDGNGTRNLTGIRKAYDTFTGGTNVALPSHTPESGTWASRWTQAAGTSWRRSGLGYARQDGDLDDVAESVTNLTVQVADGYVDFEFRVANDGGGVHVRHNGGTTKSTDNSYLLRPVSGTGALYRVSSGSQTSLGTIAGSGNWYRFYFSGDNPTILKVFRATTRAGLDDAMYIAQAGTLGILETSDATPSNQSVSGEVGLWGFYDAFGADAGAEFDNLEVVEHPFIGNAPDGGAWDASDEATYTLTEVLPFTSGASRSMSLDMRMSETAAGTKDAILAPMIVAFSKELVGGATTYNSFAQAQATLKATSRGFAQAQALITSSSTNSFAQAQAQITGGGGGLSHVAYYNGVDAGGLTNPTVAVAGVSWVPGNLIIVYITGKDDSFVIGNVADNGPGESYSELLFEPDVQGQIRSGVWTATATGTGSSATITASITEDTFAAGGGLQCEVIVVSGNSPAVDASNSDNTGATDTTNPSIDLTTIATVTRRFAWFQTRTNPFTVDEADGLTAIRESIEAGSSGGISSISSYYKDETSAGTKNASGTITATDWIAVAVSVKETGAGATTYNVFGQANSRIKQIYRAFGQTQATITGSVVTYNGFGQAQSKIYYSQKLRPISDTYNSGNWVRVVV